MNPVTESTSNTTAMVATWYSVDIKPERSNPQFAREIFIVKLENGETRKAFYEYDNSERVRAGAVPLFDEGWHEKESPVELWRPLMPGDEAWPF